MTEIRKRRAPARGARILVATTAVAATMSLVGWMGRNARAGDMAITPPPLTIRRVVVVETRPEPEPYIALQAVPAGRTVVIVRQPAQVIRRAPAAPAAGGGQAAAPVSTSSGS